MASVVSCSAMMTRVGKAVPAIANCTTAHPRTSMWVPVAPIKARAVHGSREASGGLTFSQRSARSKVVAAPVSTIKVAGMEFTVQSTR